MPYPVAIQYLKARNFRSYEAVDLELLPGVSVLTGDNGVGKTNALEACAWALLGASPRTNSEARCLRAGSARFTIDTTISTGDEYEHATSVEFIAAKGKRLAVDGESGLTVDAFARPFPAVVFLPERLLAIRGAPARRRGMLDRFAQRVIPHAATASRAYTTAVSQRNSVLRRAKASGRLDEATLAPWTEQVIKHGMEVRNHRAEAIILLNSTYPARLQDISLLDDGRIRAELRGADLEVAFDELRETELRRGSTCAGPHLDNLHFYSGDRDLGMYGSTGEQRAALLAWSLSEADAITTTLDRQPVLLLDEPFAELDATRREHLAALLMSLGSQVIVTSTEPIESLGFDPQTVSTFAVSYAEVEVGSRLQQLA